MTTKVKEKVATIAVSLETKAVLDKVAVLYKEVHGIEPTLKSLVEKAFLDLLDKQLSEKAFLDSKKGK